MGYVSKRIDVLYHIFKRSGGATTRPLCCCGGSVPPWRAPVHAPLVIQKIFYIMDSMGLPEVLIVPNIFASRRFLFPRKGAGPPKFDNPQKGCPVL